MERISSDILILGSINTDYVITAERLPRPGETVLGGQFMEARGGKGANQAVAAARAGLHSVAMVGAVGQDSQGDAALRTLEAEGICTRNICRVSDASSGVALIMVGENGENCISVAPGANGTISASQIAGLPSALFATARVFLTNLEVPIDAAAAALQRAKSAGTRTVLNPAPADCRVLDQAFANTDILTPNETEAEDLSGVEVLSAATAEAAARKLQSLGPRTIIITRGQHGSVVLDEDHPAVHVPARVVKAVDTTAAGDAFNGALVAALVAGNTLIEAVRWASTAASLAVTRLGAQPSLPVRSEIEACA